MIFFGFTSLPGANRNTKKIFKEYNINIEHPHRPIWDKADDKVVECTYNPEWKPSDPVLDGHCI